MIEPGHSEDGKEIMQLFHGRLVRNPAEAAGDAKVVGVDPKKACRNRSTTDAVGGATLRHLLQQVNNSMLQ